jgi:tetratricopeptide (TPR) repeat protein
MFVWVARRKAGRVVLTCLLVAIIALGFWNAAKPLLANYYKGQAEKALERQRYPRALASYELALRYRPDSADLHLLAARTARQAGEFTAARDHLHKCRELQQGVTEEQQVEGYLLRAQSGELDAVLNYLTPYLIEETPLTPYVLEGLARAHMASYRADRAWGCLARWNELQPANVAALFWRGTWFAQQQNTRGASEDFHRALEVDPERIDIRLAYAEILRADKKFAEVAEQYRLVLRQDPQHTDAALGLAQAYLELGQTEKAREQIATLSAGQRDSATYLWVAGMVEFRSDHMDKAEPLLRQAFERDPRNVDACYNLMLCLTHLGRDGEAAQARARFEQTEKDQKRLIELTTHDFAAQPTNAELRCELGEIYQRMALPERGVHWFLVALKLDSNCRRAHQRLLEYFESQTGADAAEKAALHRQILANLH